MVTAIKSNESIAERVVSEMWSEGNLDAVDELYAEDCVVHEAQRGTLRGREEVRAWVTEIHDAFSDVTVSIDELLSGGNIVCGSWSMQGRHTGELRPMGIPATDETVEMNGLFIARIKDGHIAEEWTVGDSASLLQQLGVLAA